MSFPWQLPRGLVRGYIAPWAAGLSGERRSEDKPMSRQPPFDGKPCPFCPDAIRNLYAVAHNITIGSHNTTLDDLGRAVGLCRPLADAHFADTMHSHGQVDRKPRSEPTEPYDPAADPFAPPWTRLAIRATSGGEEVWLTDDETGAYEAEDFTHWGDYKLVTWVESQREEVQLVADAFNARPDYRPINAHVAEVKEYPGGRFERSK